MTGGLQCPLPDGIMVPWPGDESTITSFTPGWRRFHAIDAAGCWITLGQGKSVGVPLGWVF